MKYNLFCGRYHDFWNKHAMDRNKTVNVPRVATKRLLVHWKKQCTGDSIPAFRAHHVNIIKHAFGSVRKVSVMWKKQRHW